MSSSRRSGVVVGVLLVVVEGVTSAATSSEGVGGSDGDGDDEEEGDADADADADVDADGGSGGSVVSDIRYWNPWHPPDSTWIRSARSGFWS